MIKVLAFDLFGTLVDTSSLSKVILELDISKSINPKLFIETWQSKQLQYAWFLTSINKFEPFSDLSIHALKFISKIHGIELNSDQISKFREALLKLDAFPDSKKGLELILKLKKNNRDNTSNINNDSNNNSNSALKLI